MMTISHAVSSPTKWSDDLQNDSLSLWSTSPARPLKINKGVFSKPDKKIGKKILKLQRQFGAPHHESPYCYNNVRNQNLNLTKSRSRLFANVQVLQKEVKYLQRLYLHLPKRRKIRPEVWRIQKLIMHYWSASIFNSGSDNITEDLTKTLNVIRDGFILIGTTIFKIEAKEHVKRNNTIKKKFKDIQHSHDHNGIQPILKKLNSIIAKRNGTSVPSQLCSGDHLLKIVEELMVVPKGSVCLNRSESQTEICFLSSFLTAFRRFLNRFIPVIAKL